MAALSLLAGRGICCVPFAAGALTAWQAPPVAFVLLAPAAVETLAAAVELVVEPPEPDEPQAASTAPAVSAARQAHTR
ncbi:MAG TPA: hypothetical protein VID29_00390 [Solirubrobacteraceae bacterium]